MDGIVKDYGSGNDGGRGEGAELHRVHQMTLASMTFDDLLIFYLACHDEEEERIRADEILTCESRLATREIKALWSATG